MVYKEKVMLKKNVLVIATHPDDETLGCGGTLLKLQAMGNCINWLICTKPIQGVEYEKKRKKEILKVSTHYKFDSVTQLNFLSTKLDKYATNELISKISKVINKVKPNIVFLPYLKDVHSDHRIIFDAAYSCTKAFRYPFISEIYMMEVLSETEYAAPISGNNFVPNVYFNITEYFDKKLEIIKLYKSELKRFPFPRSLDSIESLAKIRGSAINCRYAECFQLLKLIK